MNTWIDRITFRASDQPIIFALSTCGLLAFTFYSLGSHLFFSDWICIDQADRKKQTFQVDLNTAQWPELVVLPGIGEKLAKAIVQHRQMYGPFTSDHQLREVSGIGEIKHQQLIPYFLPLDVSTNRTFSPQRRPTAGH